MGIQRVVVVGGGLAGLAAATALAQRNCRVTLLESRPRLGGRASSFDDPTSGEVIDNCQHVSMGCCTNFRHFCETIGVGDRLSPQRELFFIGPNGKVNRFAASRWLPAPLHLLPALRRLSYLTRADRRSIARGLKALMRGGDEGISFADWLARNSQPESTRRLFWDVVLVSALSESAERIALPAARKVFRDGFIANRRGWQVELPTGPLSEFYGDRLHAWFDRHHVDVRLKSGVRRLELDGNRVTSVELRSGEVIAADEFVVAVPHQSVASMLPEDLAAQEWVAALARLESAPISSVHLWFDRPITDLPHAVLVDRLCQWVFRRSGESETEKSHYYQVVISNSRPLKGRSQHDIIDEVVAELRGVFEPASDAELIRGRLVTEHRAVFSPLPGHDQFRPTQETPIANLYLAGDYTKTGWPATMEGAVRSGYLAAEKLLEKCDHPTELLQPDLKPSWFSRMAFGRNQVSETPATFNVDYGFPVENA